MKLFRKMEMLTIGAIALGGIAALCLALNQIHDFARRLQGKDNERLVSPQPLEIKAATQLLSKHDFDAHVKQDEKEFAELQSSLSSLREERRQDVRTLHENIRKVDKEVAGLTASTQLQNQQLARIETTQATILQRLPRERHS